MSFYDQQVGALCFRRVDNVGPEILLITSRENKRWIIPKGWVKDGEDFEHAAAREAFEEAGVAGRVHSKALGDYVYAKRQPTLIRPVNVMVYPLRTLRIEHWWPEAGQRERRWFPLDLAADKVVERDLATLIRDFARP